MDIMPLSVDTCTYTNVSHVFQHILVCCLGKPENCPLSSLFASYLLNPMGVSGWIQVDPKEAELAYKSANCSLNLDSLSVMLQPRVDSRLMQDES